MQTHTRSSPQFYLSLSQAFMTIYKSYTSAPQTEPAPHELLTSVRNHITNDGAEIEVVLLYPIVEHLQVLCIKQANSQEVNLRHTIAEAAVCGMLRLRLLSQPHLFKVQVNGKKEEVALASRIAAFETILSALNDNVGPLITGATFDLVTIQSLSAEIQSIIQFIAIAERDAILTETDAIMLAAPLHYAQNMLDATNSIDNLTFTQVRMRAGIYSTSAIILPLCEAMMNIKQQ